MPSKPTPPSATLERLRQAKITETEQRTMRLRRENAVAARKLVNRDDVDALLLQISSRQRVALYQKLETELPVKLDGLPAGAIRGVLRATADEICDVMADLVAAHEWPGPGRLPDHEERPAKRRLRKA